MIKSNLKYIAAAASALVVTACATQPEDITTAYVSPLKYSKYDCGQIATEMDHVGRETTKLYQHLNSKANGDAWQVGASLLFWPTLFALEGGDGPEAVQYAQYKGDYEALRTVSNEKKCRIDAPSLEESVKQEVEADKQKV